MRLNRRVEKLERAVGTRGPCAVCGGQGRGRIAFAVNGSDLLPLDPRGCPACGKGYIWKRIVMDGVDEAGAKVLCALMRCAPPPAAGG